MTKKYVRYYTFFCVLIAISAIVSMYIIKKWEDKVNDEIEEELEKIKEYELNNKIPKEIKVKLTKTGEVIAMDMDEYLKGVVPSEMPPSYRNRGIKSTSCGSKNICFGKNEQKFT